MFQRRLFFIVVVILSFMAWFGSASGTGAAFQATQQAAATVNAQQVQMDPTSAKVKNNIKSYGKATLTPLPAPSDMGGKLDPILQGLKVKKQKADQVFDMKKAIYYFSAGISSQSKIKTIIVPLQDSDKADLYAFDATDPNTGDDLKIVGGIFAPALNTANPTNVMVLVYDLKQNDIVFFDQTLKPVTTTAKLEHRNFAGQGGGKGPYDGDEGGLIAARETCFTVKLDQICFLFSQPDPESQKRIQDVIDNKDEGKGGDAKSFDTLLTNIYSVKAAGTFDVDAALPDLLGNDQRKNCANALKKFTLSDNKEPITPPDCKPTTVFAPPTSNLTKLYKTKNLQLIALFIVVTGDQPLTIDKDNQNSPDGEVYDGKTANRKLKGLDPLEYLMFNPVPNIGPGNKIPLYLLNFDESVETYIPGWTIEGFGTQPPGVTTPVFTGYLKDQCSGGSCWP